MSVQTQDLSAVRLNPHFDSVRHFAEFPAFLLGMRREPRELQRYLQPLALQLGPRLGRVALEDEMRKEVVKLFCPRKQRRQARRDVYKHLCYLFQC